MYAETIRAETKRETSIGKLLDASKPNTKKEMVKQKNAN